MVLSFVQRDECIIKSFHKNRQELFPLSFDLKKKKKRKANAIEQKKKKSFFTPLIFRNIKISPFFLSLKQNIYYLHQNI